MKKKLSKKSVRIILISLVTLAVAIVAVLTVVRLLDPAHADPHAGHNHGAQSTPTHPTYNADQKPIDSYTVTENENGSFSIVVKNRMGGIMYSAEKLAEKPSFEQVSDHVLKITNAKNKNGLNGWAVYCNIQSFEVFRHMNHVLTATDTRVAFLDHRSDKWLVFVCDFDKPQEYSSVTELKGMALQASGNPELECALTKDGDLKVTYATKDSEDTVTVKMGK